MPTYSYKCEKCNKNFELFFSIQLYQEKPTCIFCSSSNTFRRYIDDVITQSSSIKKTDSELRTIGDLANRNRDKMSEDQKHELFMKHNSYKYEQPSKELPKGMSRIKKTQKKDKPKWT